MSEPNLMYQSAPFPDELADLVSKLRYRPGWTFTLEHIDRGQDSMGLTLDIITMGYNSYHIEDGPKYGVHHYMPVPPASYNRQSWMRWLFEQCLLVERHEAMEFFRFETEGSFVKRDGSHTDLYVERPYSPNHGPGNDPYIVRELTTTEDRRTSFRGDLNDG